MKNSKLVKLLSTFSNVEMKEFEKVVISPFFNRGRNYLPLYNQLKKFHPHFDDGKMTYEFIFHKMYPGKEFSKQTIWNMTSALYNMAEEYLTFSRMKKNKFVSAQQLAWDLHDRKLPQFFYKKLEEMKNIIALRKLDPPYFLQKIELETAIREYYYLEEKQHFITGHIIKGGEYAILYFLWTIVSVMNDLNVHSVVYNAQYKVNVPLEFLKNLQLKDIIDYCKTNKYNLTWLIEMYYNQIMMIIEPTEQVYFYNLKELFEKYYNEFTNLEKTNWVACLMNYCADTTHESLKNTLFEIHKFELKEGIAIYGKYLLKNHYLLILKNSLAINEIDWVKHFIDEYIPRLHPSHQKPMRALSIAFLYFSQKNFGKVIENLSKAIFRDTKDKITVKLLYLRTYFELNEPEVLLLHLDSAYHFLKNNSSGINKENALNYYKFLRSLKKLVNAREKDDYDVLLYMEKTIKDNKAIVHRDWLLEKISELIKKGAK